MLCPLLHIIILLLVSDRNTLERISHESVQVSVCYRKNDKQRQGEVRQYSDRSLDASDDGIALG